MLDVTALGELLIDFTPAGNSISGNVLFERNPGGAPPNVLTAISRLGGKCAFVGKVGDDQFGHYLRDVLLENGIEIRGLKFSDSANTTLAFVHLDEKGDRSFSFYRKPGADTMLSVADIDMNLIDDSRIFHFGSLSMTDEPARTATLKAVEYAKQKGRIISYDPNWRPPLWVSEAAAKEGMLLGLGYADILKISETELEFLTGTADLDMGSGILSDMGIKIILVTLGPKGCFYRSNLSSGKSGTYDTKVIDTTGAGDAFLGGFLFRLGRLGENLKLDEIDRSQMESMIDFSNAVGALCASRRGAIPAMPLLDEVHRCMATVGKLV